MVGAKDLGEVHFHEATAFQGRRRNPGQGLPSTEIPQILLQTSGIGIEGFKRHEHAHAKLSDAKLRAFVAPLLEGFRARFYQGLDAFKVERPNHLYMVNAMYFLNFVVSMRTKPADFEIFACVFARQVEYLSGLIPSTPQHGGW